MRRSLAIAGAFAASLAVGSARAADAPDLVAGLQHYCVSNAAQKDPVLALADADGWRPAPSEIAAQLTQNLSGYGARVRRDASGVSILIAGDTQLPAHDTKIDASICILATVPADPASLANFQDRAAAWVKVASNPHESSGATTAYVYLDDDSGRRAIVDDVSAAESKRLIGTGRLRFLIVTKDPSTAAIAYIIPKL
ncbi:MAG TPA: hypothetical protein VE309_12055 [Caulobacteraceae bacterium]|jgi:hypothetical protein|nr:hypothetical protein [Caulobacteraceae bacterium]